MPDARALTEQLVAAYGRDTRSTRQIAKRAGVSIMTAWRWSNGKASPRLPEFCFMAEALGYEVRLVPIDRRPSR